MSWNESSGPPALEFGTEPSHLHHELDAHHDGHHIDQSEGRECEVHDVQQQHFGAHDGLEVSNQQHSFYDDRSGFGIDGRLASLYDRHGDVSACARVGEDDDYARDQYGQNMQHQSYHCDASLHDHEGSENHNHDADDNEFDPGDAAVPDHHAPSMPVVTASEARAHALWLIDTLVESWWSDNDNADEGGRYVHHFPSFRLSNTEFKCVDLLSQMDLLVSTSKDLKTLVVLWPLPWSCAAL